MKRKSIDIWYVSFFFSKSNTAAAIRSSRWCSLVVKNDHNLTVFTGYPSSASAINHSMVGKTENSRVLTVSPWLFSYCFGHEIENLKGDIIKRFTGKLFSTIFADTGWLWLVPLAKKFVNVLKKSSKPDVVIMTGGPFFQMLGICMICKIYSIPYIVDYRDNWVGNEGNNLRYVMHWHIPKLAETLINTGSSSIVAASKGILLKLQGKIKYKTVLYNIPDTSYLSELIGYKKSMVTQPRNKFNIGFSGSIYTFNSIEIICQCLKELPLAMQSETTFVYCGANAKLVDKLFARHGIQSILCNYGLLSKELAICAILQCDLAISIVYSGYHQARPWHKGIITTKIFDYLILGKKIINICPYDFEIIQLLEELRCGKQVSTFAPNSKNQIISELMKYFIRWKSGFQIEFENHEFLNAMLKKNEEQEHKLMKLVYDAADAQKSGFET